jgi:hypothetical protein
MVVTTREIDGTSGLMLNTATNVPILTLTHRSAAAAAAAQPDD